MNFLLSYFMINYFDYSWFVDIYNKDFYWIYNYTNIGISFDYFYIFNLIDYSYFKNDNTSLERITNNSYLDNIIFLTKGFSQNHMHFNLYLDYLCNLDIKFFLDFNFLNSNDFRSYNSIIFNYNPELVSIFNLNEIVFNYNILSIYNSFDFNLSITKNNLFNIFFNVLIIYLIFFLMLNIINYSKINNFNFFYLNRLFFYVNSLSREVRFQFDFFIFMSLFFILLLYYNLSIFDDKYSENLEFLNYFIFYLFIFSFFFFLFKYSIHYFDFLEPTSTSKKSSLFIFEQFTRDFSNTFALLLRIFLLIFRLNIYDGLDDVLDSYYIFFCDFDDDDYSDDFFNFDLNYFFIFDNNDSSSYLNYNDNDKFIDFYNKYYLFLSEFFFFWVFLLEIFFRLLLAFYIIYLITFEVHSVNTSVYEDNYLKLKL